MSVYEGKTISVSADMHFLHPANVIWPLLCPVREYEWIETWDCDVIHSSSGVNELGCVFQTEFPTEGERETWVTNRFEPSERLEFVRVNRDRAIRFEIVLVPDETGTAMTWTQHITALSQNGVEYIKEKPEAFAVQMRMLEKFLAYYLDNGTMLKGENIGLLERIGNHVHGGKTG